MTKDTVPPQKEFYNPILQALRHLGGSGTNEEIKAEVVEIMHLTDTQLKVLIHSGTNSRKTLVASHLSWARSALRQHGLLENPRRSVWALTAEGRNTEQVDPRDVQRTVAQMTKEKKEQRDKVQKESIPLAAAENVDDGLASLEELTDVDDIIASLLGWRDELSDILHGMSPAAFERFFLRIFHRDGIEQIDVGRSGDDVIEGMMESGGFLSLRVSFRCIRGNRLINTGEIDDFRREVMMGRADKGVLVTTGKFTQEAAREAHRSSAPQIDLIDGEQLIDKLKELSLGVETKEVVVEQVIIDQDWFQNI